MKIAMGNDHTAIELKNIIKEPTAQKAAIIRFTVKK